MILSREIDRFTEPTEYITVGIDRVKAYLSSRWQRQFDRISDNLEDALLMYAAIKPEGYELYIASSQVQAYYDMHRIYGSGGGDFIDLVKEAGRMLIVEDSHKDIRLTKAKEVILGFSTLLGLPIYDHTESLDGVLVVMHKDRIEVDAAIIEEVKWLASSMEESIKYLGTEKEIDQIRKLDPLTRMISHDRMVSVLKLELARSQRSEIPFSLVQIDIDHFEEIRASYGQEICDKVVIAFAEEIATRIRSVDTACRWREGTFVILCPQTDLLGANILVNDLFSTMSSHYFPYVGRCYTSIGIADYSSKDSRVEDILLRLDKAVYRVKAFGGNAVRTRYFKH